MIYLLYKEKEYNNNIYYDFYIGYGSKHYVLIKPVFNENYKYLCRLVECGVALPYEKFVKGE